MKHVGIDVHQKYSEICELSGQGEVELRRRIPTTATALQRFFSLRKPRRVVMECGTLTPWVSRLNLIWQPSSQASRQLGTPAAGHPAAGAGGRSTPAGGLGAVL